MKTTSPLKKWMQDNRWGVRATARETGLGTATVNNHLMGYSFPSETAINKYKKMGVPHDVILDHISWKIKRGES